MFEFAGLPATFLKLRRFFGLVSVSLFPWTTVLLKLLHRDCWDCCTETAGIVAQRLLGLLRRDCWDCCTEIAEIVAQSSFHAHFHINLIYNHTSNVLTEYFGNQSISLMNQAWWLSLKGFMNSTHSSQLFYCWKSIPVGGRNFERSVSKMHFLLWNESTFVPVLWVSQSFKLLQFLLLFLNS